MTLTASVIVFLLWNVAILSPLAYPFRLFVTYVHEAGHALAAILTGGKVIQFTVSADGSGLATTAGGSRLIILPAGYIGAALFGAGLFYLINRKPNWVQWISRILGAFIIVFTALYARPDESGTFMAILIGLLVGSLLLSIGLRGTRRVNLITLSVIAIMTGLNAVLDITSLVSYADACGITNGREICNDAQAFSNEVAPFVPAAAWAILWAAISIWLCAMAVFYGLIRPMMQGDTDATTPPSTPTPTAASRRDGGLSGLKRDKDGEIDWSQF